MASYDFPNLCYRLDRKGAGNDFDLDRELSPPLKSSSPHQPPGWNDPYSRKAQPIFLTIDLSS